MAYSTNLQQIAATLTQASGPITVLRQGQSVHVQQGEAMYAGDTVQSGGRSVQLVFADGSSAQLSPKSELTIDEFAFESTANSSYILRMNSGALRAISGEVVEQNPDAFKVITPKATVGIRGTDFVVKVHEDGSENFVVLSLDQGHNVLITTHDGAQISLDEEYEGAKIGANDSELSARVFSQEEVQQIIQEIMAILGEIHDQEAADERTYILLDGDTAQAMGDVGMALLDSSIGAEGALVVVGTMQGVAPSNNQDVSVSAGSEGGNEGSLLAVVVSGSNSYTGDNITPASGKTYDLESQSINISNNIVGSNVVISGDLQDVSAGTVAAGHDIIAGLDMSEGRIVGDANTMTNGIFTGGNDTITLHNKTGGNSIYGDIATVSGGEVTFGHDSIHLTGSFSNSIISGDGGSVDTSAVKAWGNDTIVIDGNMTSASTSIYGDSTVQGEHGGNDHITVSGTVDGGSIYGGGGNDTITLSSLTSGNIFGGMGQDSIVIQGNAKGHIYDADSGTADSADDIISIWGSLQENSTVTLSGGNNVLGISRGIEAGSTISAGNGNDYVIVRGSVGQNVSIDLGEGSNTLNLQGSVGSGSTLTTGVGSDNILITGAIMGGVNINTGAGADAITLTQQVGVAGQDKVVVNSGDGNDNISMHNFYGADINSGAGNDNINLYLADGQYGTAPTSYSSINTGAGSDTITINVIPGDTEERHITIHDFDWANDTLIVGGQTASQGKLSAEGTLTFDVSVLPPDGGSATTYDIVVHFTS